MKTFIKIIKLLKINSLFIFLAYTSAAQIAGLNNGYVVDKGQYNPAFWNNNNKAQLTVGGWLGPKTSLGAAENMYTSIRVHIYKNIQLGLMASNYAHEVSKTTAFVASASYKAQLNSSNYVTLGMQLGNATTKFDYSNGFGLSYQTQQSADKTASPASYAGQLDQLKTYANSQTLLGVGIFANFAKWQIGAALPNIIKNKQPNTQIPYNEQVLERPGFIQIERTFILQENWQLLAGVNHRLSKNIYQKGLDIQSVLNYKKKYGLGLIQQRISATKGQKPLLALAEVSIKNTTLAYTLNLSSNSYPFTTIRQQVLLRLDIDWLGQKQKTQQKSI
jgi:hypothetical protein